MDYLKAHEIAKRVIREGVKTVTNEEDNFVKKVYRNLTGKSWKGCSNCWQKLYIETDIKLIETSINYKPIMSQFKLKPNKIIQLHGFNPIGEKNMTDDIALKILKSSKSHIKNFSLFPANWEELVDGFVSAPVKNSPSEPKSTEEPIVVDVSSHVDKAIEDGKEEVKEKLENMSKKELIKFCEAYQYPEKEYEKLGKDKLVNYLLKKQFE